MKNTKRVLMLLLALCMSICLLAVTVSAATVDSGTCGENGENLTWVLDDEGVLTISGEGRMDTYVSESGTPWANYAGEIATVVIEEGVTDIGNWAFCKCSSMTDIVIPDTVTYIGDYAFMYCTSLTDITIPDSVTGIGDECFGDCQSLVSAKLPQGLTRISVEMFVGCSSLKNVTIPASVEYIYGLGFAGCSSLTSIVIPENVSLIVNQAFDGCTALKSITFMGNAPRFSDDGNGGYLTFDDVVSNVYYPSDNETWTNDVMQDYGGDLTWVPYTSEKVSTPEIKSTNVASSGKPRLTWDAVSGAEKYQVYRATSKNGEYKKMMTTTGTSYTNTTAVAGKTYYYYVVAVDADGNVSEKSNIVNRTCDCARPEVTLSNVASSGKIRIKWEEVEGAQKYEVYRATSKNGTYKLMTTTTKTAITNTSAVAGKTYYYKIRALGPKEAANSAYSAVKYRTCDLPRPDVEISLNSKGKPRLTWDAVDGAVKYEVYRSTSKSGDYELLKTVTGTSLTNGSAKSGKTYYYKVRAIAEKSAANSAYSTVDSIKSK